MFAYCFGNLTGTVSTAFVLLRLVDPDSKSPVPLRMGIVSAISIPNAILMPMLMHMEPLYGMNAWMAIGVSAAIGIAYFIFGVIFKVPQTATAWEPDKK